MKRIPILLADGTLISVQASSGHYCSPKTDVAFAYSAVDILVDKPHDLAWNNGTEKRGEWTSTADLMELILKGGGIVGGQLPPLDFGNKFLVEARCAEISRQTDDYYWANKAEKEAEEAQRTREYGYVHPTVDDYDESLDDPNYEEPEEPYEGDDEE
tara:strand:- start:2028 stop:2498 length:471 start_codon:yes stop_codon:yes gene_type:complete